MGLHSGVYNRGNRGLFKILIFCSFAYRIGKNKNNTFPYRICVISHYSIYKEKLQYGILSLDCQSIQSNFYG